MSALAPAGPAALRPGERNALLLAAVLLLLTAAAWAFSPGRTPFAWLAGYVFFSLWPLGSLALLFIHALTGGRWGEAIRPGLRLGASAAPLLAPLAVPVLFSLPVLYPWARPEGAALPNRFYLNLPFFAARGLVELAVWTGLSVLAARRRHLRPLAPFALLALAVTVTTGAIDLTMSLAPRFVSSSHGMIAGAGALTLALAAAILLSPPGEAKARGDLARLLLALCALWTYLDFMQLLIVWQNDLVAQVPWYLARRAGPWGAAMALVCLLHSIGPVLALLSPRVRHSPRGLGAVCAMVVAAEGLRAWWTVLPPHRPGLPDLLCTGFMGAVAAFWIVRGRRVHGPA